MILILNDNNDNSVLNVINWLIYYEANYYRINENDEIMLSNINFRQGHLEYSILVNGIHIAYYSEIKSVWLRHFNIKFKIGYESFVREEQVFFEKERNSLLEFFFFTLSKKRMFGNYHKQNSNKLSSLLTAFMCGFSVPNFLLSSDSEFIKSNIKGSGLVTKSIQDIFRFSNASETLINFTSEINSTDLENLSDLGISMCQEKISNPINLRVFYIDNEYFSCYIRTDTNPLEIDSRLFESKVIIPITLPSKIKNSIKNFSHQSGYNTGSIDLLLSDSGKYYFLEINPCGQFGFLSYAYNGKIDFVIARKLMAA